VHRRIKNWYLEQDSRIMKPKYIIEHVHIEETVDAVEPPPPNIKRTFKNLHDWLFDICDSEKPKMAIANYSLGVFESPDSRVLFLVGLNKYTNPNYEKIDFEPKNMYFLLPTEDYRDLTWEQLADKLTEQLRDFTKTQKFTNSYLADANSIVLNGNKVIWSK
jgi:hypothetical protein